MTEPPLGPSWDRKGPQGKSGATTGDSCPPALAVAPSFESPPPPNTAPALRPGAGTGRAAWLVQKRARGALSHEGRSGQGVCSGETGDTAPFFS